VVVSNQDCYLEPDAIETAVALLDEIGRAALVSALYLTVFATAELWRWRRSPPAEWTRKLVHVGGGLIALFLPWLLHSHWTVLILGIGFAAVLAITARKGWLQSVHGVERRSEGGIYFPIAIYLVFLLSADRPEFYLIAILVLVLSDALAALVGTAYGRTHYTVETGRRSVEGSTVFFLVTFLGVHLPLLLLTDVPRASSVLIAVQIALLVTFLEAITLRGGDNLVVPLATYFLLVKMTPLPADRVALHIFMQILIVGALAVLMWRSRMLTASGMIAASVFFYGAWSLGGPEWVVAPALALLVFRWIFRRLAKDPPKEDGSYQVLAVYHTTVVAVLTFVLDDFLELLPGGPEVVARDAFYPIYLGALAAHLGMLHAMFLHGSSYAEGASMNHRFAGFLVGVGVIVPIGIAARPFGWTVGSVAAPVFMALVATLVYPLVWRSPRIPRAKPWDLRMQSATALAAALLALPLLWWVR
jgi:dolichol kinase